MALTQDIAHNIHFWNCAAFDARTDTLRMRAGVNANGERFTVPPGAVSRCITREHDIEENLAMWKAGGPGKARQD